MGTFVGSIANCDSRSSATKLAALCVILCASIQSAFAADVQYGYDAAGRLSGVVDANGNAARYNYDANGNITSIERFNAGTTAILGFTPASGYAGQTVTISGIGFSSTAAQDSVSFNGASAQITSATANALTVLVPDNANTGPIAVSSPPGSAISNTNFVILPVPPNTVPVVTGFSPSAGGYGDTVTISGSNFATAASEETVTFAGGLAQVVSTTPTSITVKVPDSAVNGPISVGTAGGTGSSSSSFYVIPAGYTNSSIGGTANLGYGQSTNYSLSDASKIYTLTFSGNTGDRVSINFLGSGSALTLVNATVYRPDGGVLTGPAGVATIPPTNPVDPGFLIGPFILPTSGIYTLVLAPQNGSVGSANISIYSVPPDLSGVLTSGSQVNISLTVPGQNAKYTFNQSAGGRAYFIFTGAQQSYTEGMTSISNPDGTSIYSTSILAAYPVNYTRYLGRYTLTQNGTFTLALDPYQSYLFSGSILYYDVPPDPSATLTSGNAATLTIGTPSQGVDFLFNASAGQKISFKISNSFYQNTSSCPYVVIYNPDGTVFNSIGYVCGASAFQGPYTLGSQSGTYKAVITASDNGTGNVTLTYYNVPADPSTTLSSGTPATEAIGTPGQGVDFVFNASAGQKISFKTSNDFYQRTSSCPYLVIYNPDGTTFKALGYVCGSSAFQGPYILGNQSGSYKVVITASDGGTGNVSLTYYAVPPDSAVTLSGASSTTLTIGTPGQGADFIFNANAGQKVTFNITNPAYQSSSTCAYVVINNPDGTVYSTIGYQCGSSVSAGPSTLGSQSGAYTVIVTLSNGGTGSITLSATVTN